MFCLPTAGRTAQLFHLIFLKPGAHLLEISCTVVILCPLSNNTYHIDELDESQPKGDINFLGHILHRPDKFVVPTEEITNQALFLLRA